MLLFCFYAFYCYITALDMIAWLLLLVIEIIPPALLFRLGKKGIIIFEQNKSCQYTIAKISRFCPKTLRHFCLLNQWNFNLNVLIFDTLTSFYPFQPINDSCFQYWSWFYLPTYIIKTSYFLGINVAFSAIVSVPIV